MNYNSDSNNEDITYKFIAAQNENIECVKYRAREPGPVLYPFLVFILSSSAWTMSLKLRLR